MFTRELKKEEDIHTWIQQMLAQNLQSFQLLLRSRQQTNQWNSVWKIKASEHVSRIPMQSLTLLGKSHPRDDDQENGLQWSNVQMIKKKNISKATKGSHAQKKCLKARDICFEEGGYLNNLRTTEQLWWRLHFKSKMLQSSGLISFLWKPVTFQ
jgi:hypothetical protein